jgi:hypothetical protein
MEMLCGCDALGQEVSCYANRPVPETVCMHVLLLLVVY